MISNSAETFQKLKKRRNDSSKKHKKTKRYTPNPLKEISYETVYMDSVRG